MKCAAELQPWLMQPALLCWVGVACDRTAYASSRSMLPQLGSSSCHLRVTFFYLCASQLLLQEAGAAFVTVHPRTKRQSYNGRADWSLIRRAKQLLSIPVVSWHVLLSFHCTLANVWSTERRPLPCVTVKVKTTSLDVCYYTAQCYLLDETICHSLLQWEDAAMGACLTLLTCCSPLYHATLDLGRAHTAFSAVLLPFNKVVYLPKTALHPARYLSKYWPLLFVCLLVVRLATVTL